MSFSQLHYHIHHTKKITTQLLSSPIIKNFFIYFVGAMLLRGVTIITAPITLNILSPNDYGLLALVNSFISIVTIFTGLGLRQVVSLEFFHSTLQERKILISNTISIYLTIMIPIFVCLLLTIPLINHYIFLNQASATIIIVSIIICFFYFFVEFFYQILQYQSKAKSITILQCTIAFVTLTLTLFFLWHLKLGILSIIGAQCIGMLLVFAAGLHCYNTKDCFKYLSFCPLKKTAFYLKQGLPFIPTVLFGWIVSSGDRWVLAQYTTLHHVGIYSLADTFGQLFQLLILNAIAGSYLPYLLNTFAKNKPNLLKVEQQNQRIMIISMTTMAIVVTLGYFLCRSFLFIILPAKYHEAVTYIWFILIGYVFLMGTYFTSSLIQFHKKAYFLAFSICLPALFNVVLNIILIPHFGIYGCVTATLISYIFYFIITLLYNLRLRKHSI